MFDKVYVNTHITIVKGDEIVNELTTGQRIVRLHRDRGARPEVDQIKGSTAALIDTLQSLLDTDQLDGEMRRCAKIAQQNFETACMYAVKALTTRPD